MNEGGKQATADGDPADGKRGNRAQPPFFLPEPRFDRHRFAGRAVALSVLGIAAVSMTAILGIAQGTGVDRGPDSEYLLYILMVYWSALAALSAISGLALVFYFRENLTRLREGGRPPRARRRDQPSRGSASG